MDKFKKRGYSTPQKPLFSQRVPDSEIKNINEHYETFDSTKLGNI